MSRNLYLQEFELFATLLILTGVGIIWSFAGASLAAAFGWMGHGLVRGLDWYLRYTRKTLKELALDIGCGGFIVLGLLALN